MSLRYLSPLIFAAALAGCATTTEDLPTMQRRAIAGIQTAQKASVDALNSGTITAAQDRDAQARLARARDAVEKAKTPADVTAATTAVGVKP